MPRYLAWSWMLISVVTGAARWRASTAASRLCGQSNGTTTVFERLSLRLEKSAYASKIFMMRGRSL
eukprot:6348760-Alexandrium_andersonii.AAC.1